MPDSPFVRDEWLSQVTEPIIDPDRPIVDPHHHLWDRPEIGSYLLDELLGDTGSGHNVTTTVFVECGSAYLPDGPEHLRPVGETAFVAGIAAKSDHAGGAVIGGIVSHADLRIDPALLDEVLDAHVEAGDGRFRGIRDAGSCADEPAALAIAGRAPSGLYADPDFRRGVAHLGDRGFTYDTWHYHHQNRDFLDLAQAVPGTTMILDHFGTPVGVGKYAGQQDEIFATWKDDIAAIAECPNVVAKLGGLAMPDNGFGWHLRETPATSDEFAEEQGRYYEHTVACFGADRCMVESNFPVDRLSISYAVLFNGIKKILANHSETEKDQMFSGTATRVYRL